MTGNLKKGEFVLRHVLRYSLKSHHGKEVHHSKVALSSCGPGSKMPLVTLERQTMPVFSSSLSNSVWDPRLGLSASNTSRLLLESKLLGLCVFRLCFGTCEFTPCLSPPLQRHPLPPLLFPCSSCMIFSVALFLTFPDTLL